MFASELEQTCPRPSKDESTGDCPMGPWPYQFFECIKSKVQDRIWVPDSNQDDSLNEDASSQNDQSQSALSLLSRPLKALPPPLNGPYPSTSTQKQRKFENNKRAASPSGTEILVLLHF